MGGVTVNIHALGRDPPCPCHTATPKRYLLSARVTTASSASFRDKFIFLVLVIFSGKTNQKSLKFNH